MKLIKFLLLMLCILSIDLSFKATFAVEPEEILKDKNQELRARNISQNIRKTRNANW